MINNSAAVYWWIWWGNPLEQIHPHQLIKHSLHRRKLSSLSYKDIDELRRELAVPTLPEREVLGSVPYGLITLYAAEDLYKSLSALPAITFGSNLLKLTPSDWQKYLNVTDKEHIRALIQLSNTISKNAASFLDVISDACGDIAGKTEFPLFERSLVVLGLFYQKLFPKFYRRWMLTFPDEINSKVEFLLNHAVQIDSGLVDLIDIELRKLLIHIESKHKIEELDFETLADQEIND